MRRRAVARRTAASATALLLALTTACAGPSPDAASGRPPRSDPAGAAPLRVLVAGDSLTTGYFASAPEKGFADLVTARLAQRHDVTSLRAAVPGARTWRIAREVRDVTRDEAPVDVAIVEAGSNDVGTTTRREWLAWYRRLLRAVAAGSPDAVVVCLGPWGGRDASARYERVVRRLCADHAYVALSPLFEQPGLRGPRGVVTELGARDGFHPNDRGHAAVARDVVEALERLGIA